MKTNENTQAEQSPKNAGVGPAKAVPLKWLERQINLCNAEVRKQHDKCHYLDEMYWRGRVDSYEKINEAFE